MSQDMRALLQGKFPLLKKQKKQDLLEECKMWRNLWQWIPGVIKHYVSQTGTMIGVTVRNYKRYIGPLLDTKWELKEIEVGVFDRVYDPSDGQYYMERKIVRLPIPQIVAFDWIAERIPEEEFAKQEEQETEQEEEKKSDDITI